MGAGEAKLFLRTVTVSGAGVLRFSDILIMRLRVWQLRDNFLFFSVYFLATLLQTILISVFP